jgi:hypothetical protein
MDARLVTHFRSPFFLVGWVLYFLVHADRSITHFLPNWLSGFLPDFLCLPLILWISLGMIRFVFKDYSICLSPLMIVVGVLAFSTLFEWILPTFREIYTADIFDVLAYALGGLSFYWWQKEKPQQA